MERFEYVTLAAALLGTFALVWRLGAGLHGLGRRGLALVLLVAVALGLGLAYAELVRRYGTPGLVDLGMDAADALRDATGGAPAPLAALLGVPALVWGTHVRARRRQGWWVCAFGVTATARTAQSLALPGPDLLEVGVSALWTLAVGVLVGWAVVRLDLRLRGPRGALGRREEAAAASRPEPPRWRALL